MTRRRILLSWSTGKDSAWALHRLRRDPSFRVCGLLTTLTAGPEGARNHVAAHGVREELLLAQSAAVGLPLHRVHLPHPCPNAEYEARVAGALCEAMRAGISGIAYGDLFLEDIRRYRERQMQAIGLEVHFPLWGSDTQALAWEMVRAGVRARLTCVDPTRCPRELAGQDFDAAFLRRLPAGVDPCGENGEFHTFAYAGPEIPAPIPVRTGAVAEREGLVFADLERVGGACGADATASRRPGSGRPR